MGLGPFVFERIANGKIHRAIIPISLFIISLFIFDVAFVVKQFVSGNYLPNIFESITLREFLTLRFSMRFIFDLFSISFFGGIFTVSQYSELQRIVDKTSLSPIVAGNNILNAFFMVMVSLLIMFLFQLEFSIHIIFGIIGILNIGAAVLLVFFHRHEFNNLWRF
jgi:hypothetical protein